MPSREIVEAVAAIADRDRVTVLEDPDRHEATGRWIVKVRLRPDDLATHPEVPRETEWYLHLRETYPAGSIGIYPADQEENTITATFPHQKLNVAGSDDTPWRRGNICVARYGHILSQTGATGEPSTAADRLCWYMDRALEWLKNAAQDDLRKPDEPFEIPAFDTNSASGPTLAFNETQESFAIWKQAYGKWGMVDLRALPTAEETYATGAFKDSDDEVVYQPDWGGYIEEETDDSIAGAWVLLEELPIEPPWEAPESWQDLEVFFEGTETDPYELRANIKPVINTEPTKILLLGFPIPATVGGDPEIIYWQPIEIQAFKNPNDLSGGFRDAGKGPETAARREAEEEQIWWLDADNWSHEQLIRRGHMDEWFLDRNIVLIGAGALGSTVAENLVRAGCRRLTIVDDDAYEIGNVARHTLTIDDVGRNKATALSDRLQSVAPYVQAIYVDSAFLPDDGLPESITEADVVIECTASRGVRRALDGVRWNHPVVFCSAAMGRRANRLFTFTAYSHTFPYREYTEAFAPWRLQEQVEWDDDEDAVPERVGCWHPASVIRTDRVMTWAGTVTRLLDQAPRLSLGKTDFTVLETPRDTELPTISPAPLPFQDVTTWQAPDFPIMVQVPSMCLEAMYERCRKEHPCETGGIVAGTDRNDGPALVINTRDPPRDSIQEPTRFLRGIEEVEEWLRDARESIGIDYFGEWHYHPDAAPEISREDRTAMNEIANDDGYDCPHPLLFIVGQDDEDQFTVNAYLFHRSKDYEQLAQIDTPDETPELFEDGDDA
jgi:proteasome lid subunit RPN8/RPN11